MRGVEMKKTIFLIAALLLVLNSPLYAELTNPYVDRGMEDTQKIMVSFFETVENKRQEIERLEIGDTDIPKILDELNRTIEYEPGMICDCMGDGKLFFLLKDGKEVEFRVKHGGNILEYNCGEADSQFLEMPDEFKQIIIEYYPEDKRAFHEKSPRIDSYYIPKNLDECFIELKKLLTPEQLVEFKSKKEDEIVEYHFSIGRWMRNFWRLWGKSRLKDYFNNLGIYHPDDMSGIILPSFHRHLHNKDIKLEEQIKYYQDWWKKTNREEFYKYYSEILEYRKRPEVQFSSITSDHNDCDAFRKIVERGEVFLPFIIDEIKKGDFFLNQAMGEITGFDIMSMPGAKEVGGEQDVSKLWIEWWKENKERYRTY
jgi:hypothetical protein